MKTKHLLYAIGGVLAFSFLKGRGFSLGKTPNFSRMNEGQIITYLRKAYRFDDTKVNEFMSGYRETKALREMNAPDFSTMSIGDLNRYIDRTFHVTGTQSTSLLRSMESYLKAKMTPDFYRRQEPELRAFLRKTYGYSEQEIALLFRVYQELIFKRRLQQQPSPDEPQGWLQKVEDVVIPSWLTWELFSWETLKAVPGALAKIPEMELERLMTPSGIAGLGLALLIGPEILAFWGFAGETAVFGAMDYWIASSNAKDIIDGALRSGPAGGFAVMTGNVAGSFLGGGAQGAFLRQLAGNLAGDNIAFQIESTLKSK